MAARVAHARTAYRYVREYGVRSALVETLDAYYVHATSLAGMCARLGLRYGAYVRACNLRNTVRYARHYGVTPLWDNTRTRYVLRCMRAYGIREAIRRLRSGNL
jgi:hypothetical protein